MAAEPGGAAVVRALWEAIEDRDWDRVGGLLHDEFVLEWPQSGEVIRGRANFVAVNAAYPGDWHIAIERIHDLGQAVLSEVRVDFPERADRAVSLFTTRDGRIATVREWWPDPFPAAEWRRQWAQQPEH